MARRIVTPKGRQVRIEGLAELREKAAVIISRAVGKDVKKIWMQAALELRDAAREYAPVAAGPITHYAKGQPPQTIMPGALKAAIFAAYGKDSAPDVLVGVNYKIAPHAHWLEFGNSRIPPQPYMRPAISLMRARAVQIIADGYRTLLIENGSVSEPTSPDGRIDPPVISEKRIRAVRERAVRAWAQKGKQ